MLILTSINGPDKGSLFEFPDEGRVILGRDGPLSLSDTKVSRHHAELWFDGGKWYAKDLSSRNGTLLNRREIEGFAELHSGDWIQLGRTLLAVGIVPGGRDMIAVEPIDKRDASLAGVPAIDPNGSGSGIGRPKPRPEPRVSGPASSDETTQRIAAAVREALAADRSRSDPVLRQITEQLKAQGTQHAEVAETLRAILSGQHDRPEVPDGAPAPPVGEDTLYRVAERLIADVRGAVVEAVAAQPPQPELQRIIGELAELQAGHDRFSAEVQQRLTGGAERTEAALRQVAAQIEAQAARQDGLAAGVREAAATGSSDTQTILREMNAQLASQEERQRAAAAELKAAVEAAPVAIAPRLQSISERLAAQDERHTRLAATLREAVAGEAARGEPALRGLAEELHAQRARQDEILAALHEATAQGQAGAAAVAPVLQRVEAELAAQPARHEELVASVQEAIAAQPMLAHIVNWLKAREGRDDQLLAAIREAAPAGAAGGAASGRIEPLVKAVAARVETQAAEQAQLAAWLRESVADGASRHGAALAEIVNHLRSQDDRQQALVAAVREAVASESARHEPGLRQLLTQAEAQRSPHGELARVVRDAVAAETSRTHPVLTGIAARLEAQEARHAELMAAIRDGRVTLAPPDRGVVARLEPQPAADAAPPPSPAPEPPAVAADGQPVHAPWLAHPEPMPRRTRIAIAASVGAAAGLLLLGSGVTYLTSRGRPPVPQKEAAGSEVSREAAQAISKLVKLTEQPDGPSRLREAMRKADTKTQEDYLLALREMERNPLAEIAENARRTGELLREIQREQQAQRLALAQAGRSGAEAAPSLYGPDATVHGRIVEDDGALEAGGGALTKLQQDYRDAYVTGVARTIGGRLDPATGKLVGGRLLDPRAARAEGLTSWKDWYDRDDKRERQRLGEQARRAGDTAGADAAEADPDLRTSRGDGAVYLDQPWVELQLRNGDKEGALRQLGAARSAAALVGDPTRKAPTLSAIAAALHRAGEVGSAKQCFNEAKAVVAGMGDPADRARGYRAIAEAQRQVGDISGMVLTLESARAAAQKIEAGRDAAVTADPAGRDQKRLRSWIGSLEGSGEPFASQLQASRTDRPGDAAPAH